MSGQAYSLEARRLRYSGPSLPIVSDSVAYAGWAGTQTPGAALSLLFACTESGHWARGQHPYRTGGSNGSRKDLLSLPGDGGTAREVPTDMVSYGFC